MQSHTHREANLFQLQGGEAQLTYSTSSLDGQPQLSYQEGERSMSFRGEQLRRAEGALGVTVSVTIEAIPDLRVVTLHLLVPAVNLRSQEAQVQTVAVLTTERSSIGGPALVEGALQEHRAVALQGTASAVLF